jgi:hypothetical protein
LLTAVGADADISRVYRASALQDVAESYVKVNQLQRAGVAFQGSVDLIKLIEATGKGDLLRRVPAGQDLLSEAAVFDDLEARQSRASLDPAWPRLDAPEEDPVFKMDQLEFGAALP